MTTENAGLTVHNPEADVVEENVVTEETVETTETPEPATAIVAEAEPVIEEVVVEETVAETPAEPEVKDEEPPLDPDKKIPKLGKGGPVKWFKKMALMYGDHPRVLARMPKVLNEAGIGTEILTEEFLKQMTRECWPDVQAWVKGVNSGKIKCSAAHVEQDESVWYNMGQILADADKARAQAAEAKKTKEEAAKNGTVEADGKATKTTKQRLPRGEGPKKGEHGVKRSKDLPWNAKKVAVFKALKKLGAIGPSNAMSSKIVAEEAKVKTIEVRHYCYHAKAAGLTDVVNNDTGAGYAFCLTEEGAKINPDEELKKVS